MKFDLQLGHIRTLIAIADEGSFEAAARQVARTQSAVTQQMQKLEELIGTPLFHTTGRRRELTTAGLTLVNYGREILSLSQYALAAVDQANEHGVVRIGAPQEIAEHILPDILSRFADAWPAIRVIIHVERSPLLMKMLHEQRLDIALSTRRSELMEGALIMTLPAQWIAATSYRRNPHMPLPLILADEPSMFRRIALASLDLSGMPYIERITSPSLAGVRLSIASGLGVTVRTESSFFAETRILGEEDGLPPLPNVNYYAYRASRQPPPPVAALYKLLLMLACPHQVVRV